MIRWKRSWPDLPEDLPVDVMPASNGEFIPPPPAPEQVAAMELANQQVEYWRRKFNMSRRDFVRTAAAYTIGFWALGQVSKGEFGNWAQAHHTRTNGACDLEWENAGGLATLYNLEGEFIFDVQSHHVESDGMWRVTNPGFEAFFAAIWSQVGGVGADAAGDQYWLKGDPSKGIMGITTNDKNSGAFVATRGGKEYDPIENLSRYHYLKELFLDSASTMTVLSAVPAAPDITQPLPIDKAALTVAMVNELAGSARTVMHAFVMPNRGSAGGTIGAEPIYMQREFEIMEERASVYRSIRGWKTYPAWGDIPYASGWFFDDAVGQAFIEKVKDISARKPWVPPNIATHKGFALPGFDQRAASPRDIGPAASRNPGVNFIVYHSGYDSDQQLPYPGDDKVNSADRTVNSFIKSLRENRWDATRFIKPGLAFGNVPNVFAEIGSTWRSVISGAVAKGYGAKWDGPTGRYAAGSDQAAHLLGKLITYVGPKRICWGTDSLWFGSPQSEIIALRSFEFTKKGQDLYKLPYGLNGDADDPRVDCMNPANYGAPHPAGISGWPTDGKPHPERSIRNGIFGRNAAEVYRVAVGPGAAGAHMTDRGVADSRITTITSFNVDTGLPTSGGLAGSGGVLYPPTAKIDCNDVQAIRDGYILNQMTPKEMAPLASNTVVGPRTRRELFKMRAEQPWGP